MSIPYWKDSLFSALENRQLFHKTAAVMSEQVLLPPSTSVTDTTKHLLDETAQLLHDVRRGKSAAEVVSTVKRVTSADARKLLRSPEYVSAAIHALLSALRFENGATAIGDLPLFFAGRALKNGIMNDELWSDVMLAVVTLNVSEKLFTLWQDQLYDHYGVTTADAVEEGAAGEPSSVSHHDDEHSLSAGGDDFDIIGADGASTAPVESDRKLIPFKAMHAMLSWAANAKDMEKAMKLYHVAKVHGVQDLVREGALDASNLCRLAVKVIAAARNTQFDGGIRKMMVNEIHSIVPASTLLAGVSWGVLNDLLVGLSFSSALTMVKVASERRGGDEHVPFYIWAALLRAAAKKRCIAEAEQLFLFLRKRFSLTAQDKSELLDVMLRMHAPRKHPDFVSALSLFMEHVVNTPDDEPRIDATAEHYKLLIRAAESRNAAAMMFLEGCSKGMPHDSDTFSSLFARNPSSSLSSLSQKLPREYSSSDLDSHLKIPADSDAHARREEALQFRGKQLVDSTSLY